MTNCHGSHVLRSLLCLCKGVPLDSSDFHSKKSSSALAHRLNFKSRRSDGSGSHGLHPGFPDMLKFLVSEILKAAKKDIEFLQVDQYGSLVLQVCFMFMFYLYMVFQCTLCLISCCNNMADCFEVIGWIWAGVNACNSSYSWLQREQYRQQYCQKTFEFNERNCF